MNMPKSRDIQAKIPLPQAIWNEFGYVTVNGVNSNVFSITREGETADIQHYLDEHKISEESQYDGLYAVCTDLLGDEVSDILKVSEGRWQIEEFFTSAQQVSPLQL